MTGVEYLDPDDPFRLADDWAEQLTDIAEAVWEADTRGIHNAEVQELVRERLRPDAYGDLAYGEGAGRIVERLPEEAYTGTGDAHAAHEWYVVKFAKTADESVVGPSGHVQNDYEAHVWEETRSEYLLPVTAVHESRKWLVMPFGDLDYPHQDAEDVQAWRNAASDRHGGEDVYADDIHEDNIVWWVSDESLRLCDYGTPAGWD